MQIKIEKNGSYLVVHISKYFSSYTLQVRFLADLVNCHVIVAASLLAMFDNFVEVTLEDNIPQVSTVLNKQRETQFTYKISFSTSTRLC